MRLLLVALAVSLVAAVGWPLESYHESSPQIMPLPSLRNQVILINSRVRERKALIPEILRRAGVEAWLITQLENAEDPVFWILKDAEQLGARRRTVFLFLSNTSDDDDDEPREYSWVDDSPHVWSEVAAILDKRNITKIATNEDPDIGLASGLHVGEARQGVRGLTEANPKGNWGARFVPAPGIPVTLIALQTEMGWYRRIQETAWAIIQEALSRSVIKPDRTTTRDVEWWMRDKIQALNYTTWIHPNITILNPRPEDYEDVISYGHVLHADFGLTAMGMNTDTQHLGYVLHPFETEDDVPEGLKLGLFKANQLQDIVKQNMRPERSGNDVLKASLEDMRAEGINGKIYCHPVGDWGHSAGTLIGTKDRQDFVPRLGEKPIASHTWYSIELQVEHFVPELGRTLQFPVEENVYWSQGENRYAWVYGRQEFFHVVKTWKRRAYHDSQGLKA